MCGNVACKKNYLFRFSKLSVYLQVFCRSQFIIFFSDFIGIVNSHVCILRRRFDPSSGMIRWSLSKKEICFCQGIVAPEVSAARNCPRYEDADKNEELWFTDDPTFLTNRKNWTPKKLDAFLNRTHCCECWLT